MTVASGAFDGEVDAKTAFGDIDVDLQQRKNGDQPWILERAGPWDGGSKKGDGFEVVGSVGGAKGMGRIELITEEGDMLLVLQ